MQYVGKIRSSSTNVMLVQIEEIKPDRIFYHLVLTREQPKSYFLILSAIQDPSIIAQLKEDNIYLIRAERDSGIWVWAEAQEVTKQFQTVMDNSDDTTNTESD